MSTSEGIERGYGDGMAIGRSIGNAVTYLFLILSRPLTLLTQVFYRKSMGERYFTPISLLGGLAFLAVATFASKYMLPTVTTNTQDQWGRMVVGQTRYVMPPIVAYGVGIAWIAVLLVAYSRHTLGVRKRYATGERWHSYNSGVPHMAALVDPVQYLISGILAAGCFYWGLPGYGALLSASIVLGVIADQAARKRFWNSVLDAVDAQIESENLGKAVAERLSPGRVEGLEAPVPGYVSEEWRKRNAGSLSGR